MRIKRIAAVLFAAALMGGGAVACTDEPACEPGYTLEYDDDGYECEPDSDGNGIDDEED